MSTIYKAVFLDKDGTLIKDVPYNVDPLKITLNDHCLDGLKRLQESGFLLVIVTNQSGVARGYFREQDLLPVEQTIQAMLKKEEIVLNGFFYCPHHPQGIIAPFAIDCSCRKPQPGLLIQAADLLDIDLKSSWMIGDILNDVEAGNTAGCRTILIDNGNETEWIINEDRHPVFKVQNIDEAANCILNPDHGKLV